MKSLKYFLSVRNTLVAQKIKDLFNVVTVVVLSLQRVVLSLQQCGLRIQRCHELWCCHVVTAACCVVTAAAWVTAVVQVQSLVPELPMLWAWPKK